MSIRISQIAIWWQLMSLSLCLPAQDSYRIGALPSVNIHRTLSPNSGINFKGESRQVFREGIWDRTPSVRNEFSLVDLSVLGVQKIGIRQKLAGGYLIRIRDQEVFHRAIQQLSFIRPLARFTLANRLAADQTFGRTTKPTFRLRYRLSIELPLAGLKADAREWYIKVHNEYLSSWQKNVQSWELRGVPMIGYKFSDKNKLELGFDYRLTPVFQEDKRSSFWVKVNGFIRI